MDDLFDDLHDPDAPPPGAVGPTLPPPRRRLRHRLVFLPPLILVSLACLAFWQRSKSADWQGIFAFRPSRPRVTRLDTLPIPAKVEPPRIIVKAAPAPPVEMKKDVSPVLASKSVPNAPPAVPEEPAITRDPLPRPSATPGEPALAKAEPAPPKPKEVWEDIQTEVAIRKREREELEALKPTLEVKEKRDREFDEKERRALAIRSAEADRVPFRRDLKKAIDTWGARSAPAIRILLRRHVADTTPEIAEVAADQLEQGAGRLDRRGKVALFRAVGLPEVLIFQFLVDIEMRNIVARDGPRNEDEAIVRAARQLLAVPTNLAPRPSPPPVPADRLRRVGRR